MRPAPRSSLLANPFMALSPRGRTGSRRYAPTRRIYAVEPRPLADVDVWFDRFRRFLGVRHPKPLATEIARDNARGNRDAMPRRHGVDEAQPFESAFRTGPVLLILTTRDTHYEKLVKR